MQYVGDWPVIWEILTERKSRLAALQVVFVRSHCWDFTLVKSINLKRHTMDKCTSHSFINNEPLIAVPLSSLSFITLLRLYTSPVLE